MFSQPHRDFMANSMKIVVESIESKLNERFFSEYKALAAAASIAYYIEAIKDLENSEVNRDLTSGQDNQAKESIRRHFLQITDGMDDSDPVYHVFDALRHSFSCYAYNGLHQLYTRQENESWHPKIILTGLLKPNDIDSLSPDLTIYRGCNISELECEAFGQAWSTSPSVAREFAFKHYQGQDWFDETRRVVLEAKCSRDDLLFSDQSVEFEVVVDVRRLRQVKRVV